MAEGTGGGSRRDEDRASRPAWLATESERGGGEEEGTRDHERGLNTDSAIPGRLAFHRQSGPSTGK